MKRLMSLLLLITLTITLSGCKKEQELPGDYIFELLGANPQTIFVDQPFYDSMFIARYQSEDISDYVTVSGEVDSSTAGEYTITYTLDHKGNVKTLTRTVYVEYTNLDYCQDVLASDGSNTGYDKCQLTWSSYLNTVVTLSLYIEDDQDVDFQEINSQMTSILALYTILSDKYKEYEYQTNIWTINQNPTNTHQISQELFDLIQFSLDSQTDLVDYYNIALQPVLELWHNSREACSSTSQTCYLPDPDALEIRRGYTDPSLIILDEENLTITMGANMGLDLGGISKGYVSGLLIDYLETLDVYGYLLNNGQSNVSVGGINPRTADGSFTIAVTDPTDPYDISGKHGYAWVSLTDGEQLVTSGDYQKFFEFEGDLYHHIIDPVSLYPLYYSRAVSIVIDDPAIADLYSTAIFNMTIEDGLAFVNGIDGLEAIWYLPDGTIVYSENFETDHLLELR